MSIQKTVSTIKKNPLNYQKSKLMAKMILDSSDLKYEIVDAEENLDLTNQFKIQQAPTLVVVNSGNVQSFANVSNIKKYVKG